MSGAMALTIAAGVLVSSSVAGAFIDPTGSDPAETIVGDAPFAAPPDGEGLPAEATNLFDVADVAIHPWTGEVYWIDNDKHRIRRLDNEGRTWTVAGTGTAGFSGDGGDAAEAQFHSPLGLDFDGDGNLFVADTLNHRIRRIDTLGFISTVAGSGVRGEGADIGDNWLAVDADLAYPSDVAVHEGGRFLFVADTGNHRVRRVNVGGIITTFAGSTEGFSGDFGPPSEARLSSPEVVTLDHGRGTLYISDGGNQRVRSVGETNQIVTVAGDGTTDLVDGPLANATGVGVVRGIAVDYEGQIFLTEHSSDRVRVITRTYNLITFSGAGTGAFGTASNETYLDPTAVTFDREGRFLIGDDTSIVRVTPSFTGLPLPRLNPYGRPAEDQVRRLYRAAFGRVPDAGGLRFWVDRYQGDGTMLSLAASFISSGESIAIYGENPTDEEFLAIVYMNVLGRGPDGGGLAFWLDQLSGGRSRASVLAAFADSIENVERTRTAPLMTDKGMEVLRLYRAAFGRVPDSGGFAFWLERRSAGASLSTLAASFIASPEASGYIDNPEDSLFIEALYGNVLRRNADAPGLAFWEGQMRSGMSRADVVVAFSESPENRRLTGTA